MELSKKQILYNEDRPFRELTKRKAVERYQINSKYSAFRKMIIARGRLVNSEIRVQSLEKQLKHAKAQLEITRNSAEKTYLDWIEYKKLLKATNQWIRIGGK